jgi:hypothetical protein
MIGAKDAPYPTVARHVKIDQDIPAATTTILTISAERRRRFRSRRIGTCPIYFERTTYAT